MLQCGNGRKGVDEIEKMCRHVFVVVVHYHPSLDVLLHMIESLSLVSLTRVIFAVCDTIYRVNHPRARGHFHHSWLFHSSPLFSLFHCPFPVFLYYHTLFLFLCYGSTKHFSCTILLDAGRIMMKEPGSMRQAYATSRQVGHSPPVNGSS